jgi:hypothetical protein
MANNGIEPGSRDAIFGWLARHGFDETANWLFSLLY